MWEISSLDLGNFKMKFWKIHIRTLSEVSFDYNMKSGPKFVLAYLSQGTWFRSAAVSVGLIRLRLTLEFTSTLRPWRPFWLLLRPPSSPLSVYPMGAIGVKLAFMGDTAWRGACLEAVLLTLPSSTHRREGTAVSSVELLQVWMQNWNVISPYSSRVR